MIMKYSVTRFKSLSIALKEIEPFVRDGSALRTGRPFKKFGGMLPREVLGNLLMCLVLNHEHASDAWLFTSDPTKGDGILLNEQSNETWHTEHVMVSDLPSKTDSLATIENRILDTIQSKVEKGGDAYASGKILVVFINSGGGAWQPNAITRQLPKPLHFANVWAIGLQHMDDGEYVYGVAQLDLSTEDAPTWLVRIKKQFEQWNVLRIQ